MLHARSQPAWHCLRSAVAVLFSLGQFTGNVTDRCVELLQREGLDQHRRLHSIEEKFYLRIILVTGEENEPLASARPDPRHGPIKHLAPDLRHHHVAKDQIEGILKDLAQTLDATRD